MPNTSNTTAKTDVSRLFGSVGSFGMKFFQQRNTNVKTVAPPTIPAPPSVPPAPLKQQKGKQQQQQPRPKKRLPPKKQPPRFSLRDIANRVSPKVQRRCSKTPKNNKIRARLSPTLSQYSGESDYENQECKSLPYFA